MGAFPFCVFSPTSPDILIKLAGNDVAAVKVFEERRVVLLTRGRLEGPPAPPHLMVQPSVAFSFTPTLGVLAALAGGG